MRYITNSLTLKFTLLLACVTALASPSAQAQSPSNSLWEIHLDLRKSVASPLGQRIMAMIEKDNPKDIEEITKLAEAIGIDPLTDIGEVVVFGNGFTETDATIIAQLSQSTGNLEGWILAAPGYRSEDIDNNTLLHSIFRSEKVYGESAYGAERPITAKEQNARIWFALPKHPQSGNYVLVGSFDQNRTVELAKQVLAGNASPIPNPLQGNTLFSFYANDLSAVPIDIDENAPGSGIVKIIERLGLKVTSDDTHLGVTLDLSASSAGKARQISQLLTGLKALVQLAPQDDPEGQKLSEVLESLVIEHSEGEPNVQASLSTSYQLVEEFLRVVK